jgi:hypothetical protein
MFARPDLPKLASIDPTNPTPEEAKAITVGSVAYFGTYTVDEPTKTISLKIESISLPNQLGIDQKTASPLWRESGRVFCDSEVSESAPNERLCYTVGQGDPGSQHQGGVIRGRS